MDLLPIHLGIARPVGSAKKIKSGAKAKRKSPASLSKIDKELKEKIFERDDYTCQCCGFQSKKYQEVHFKNSNKADLRESNLATVCIFCYQCFNIQDVPQMRSGALIWLPEISQMKLHHMARAIYVARISQGPMADAARKTLDILMKRREEAKKRLQTDDPYILSLILQDYLSDKSYHMRKKKLEGVRLFPLDRRIIKESDLEFNQFPQILAYWRSKAGPFGGKTPPQWMEIYQDILARAA